MKKLWLPLVTIGIMLFPIMAVLRKTLPMDDYMDDVFRYINKAAIKTYDVDGIVDNRDVTALLIYWVGKRCIEI